MVSYSRLLREKYHACISHMTLVDHILVVSSFNTFEVNSVIVVVDDLHPTETEKKPKIHYQQ